MAKSVGLEAFRLTLYVLLPIGATFLFSNPPVMHRIVNELNYIIYPPEGKRIDFVEEIARFRKERKERK